MKCHFAIEKQVTEWSYLSTQQHADPFNTIELDVIITHGGGSSWRIPAFWAGDQEWRVRFSPPHSGKYHITTICTDTSDFKLHGVKHSLEATPYQGNNPLFIHGPLRIAGSKRTFEHADGTPFFWLGDTLWMGLCKRMSWPDDYQLLIADRAAKGFTVIQIIAGLYPDMPGFDERGANEAGFPWERDYSRINPAYFDAADLRICWLVQNGLVPCIIGSWGYYLPLLGINKMKQHWRNLIARWGAYPIVWCLAGEASMPYYLSNDKEADKKIQLTGWTEIGRFVREIDPYSRLITIHPNQIGRDQVKDDSVIDFDMLQTGHGGYESVQNTVDCICREYQRIPTMPVLVGEVNYEGIIHGTQDEVQRLTFWSSILSGTAGHTYGANGIWQLNTKEKPYGPSPHGGNWGNTPWQDACQLAGSQQLGLARQFLERYRWWEFEPHQEWVDPAGNPKNVRALFAAGIPGQVRIIYFYEPTFPWLDKRISILAIEPDVIYSAFFWDPRTGDEHPIGKIEPDTNYCWQVPLQPTFNDWVLVFEATGARV